MWQTVEVPSPSRHRPIPRRSKSSNVLKRSKSSDIPQDINLMRSHLWFSIKYFKNLLRIHKWGGASLLWLRSFEDLNKIFLKISWRSLFKILLRSSEDLKKILNEDLHEIFFRNLSEIPWRYNMKILRRSIWKNMMKFF